MTRSATAASTRTDNGWPSGWDSTICCARHPVWPPEVGCLIPAQTGLAQRFLSYYTSPASPLAAAPGRGGGPPLGTGTLVPHARGPGTATICCNREWSFCAACCCAAVFGPACGCGLRPILTSPPALPTREYHRSPPLLSLHTTAALALRATRPARSALPPTSEGFW